MGLRAYVEGPTDVLLAIKVAQHAGLDLKKQNVIAMGGYGAIDTNLSRLRQLGSPKDPVWVLRDCDPTAPNFKGQRFARCGGTVISKLGFPNAAPGWRLRLARHEAESWLMADADAFAAWLGVSPTAIPPEPDELLKAKNAIVRLARTSTKSYLRAGLVPREGSSAEFGPRFEETLQQFISGPWNPKRAANRSRSLRRCLAALKSLRGT
jgi:hypothetical protein